MKEGIDWRTTSFSNVPKCLIKKAHDVVKPSPGSMLAEMRDAYEEAITDFCDDLDKGETVIWPQTNIGADKHRQVVRLSLTAWNRMDSAVKKYGTRKSTFFRLALVRWLRRKGAEDIG